MKGVSIRPAQKKDLGAIASLLEELNVHVASASTVSKGALERVYSVMAGQPDFYRNYVAVIDKQVAGLLSMVFYKTYFHAGGTALINELVVAKRMRGSGVGTSLVKAAIAEAKKKGMDEVEVGTELDNRVAQNFYRNSGFTGEYRLLALNFEGS